MKKSAQPLILLRTTVENICQHPVIIYPSLILALTQLLILEILYFAPRYPLLHFFGPLISHIWSEEFLHYPMDLILLPKLFYYAQILVYLFGGAFLLSMTSYVVASLNTHARANLRNAYRESSRLYVHLLCSSIISLILFQVLSSGYTAAVNDLLRIKTPNPGMAVLQKTLLWATPYMQFFIGIFVTTLLVYVIPIIIIEKEKIFTAVAMNLAVLLRSFRTSLLVVLVPTLFYLPILVARNNVEALANATLPEIQIFIIALGILVTMAIDLVVLTTVTTHYLYLKESS
jgi:hypothetical protein